MPTRKRAAPLDARPSMTPALERVIAGVIAVSPEFLGLDARRILVVALGAHGDAVASVRSLAKVSKRVVVAGEVRVVELGLRPRFFQAGDAPRRVATLIHELLHLDTAPARAKAGALLEEKRHTNRSHAAHETETRAIARRFLDVTAASGDDADATALLCLAHHGEVLLRQWLRRPVDGTEHTSFDDDDVFEGPLHISTPLSARGGWW